MVRKVGCHGFLVCALCIFDYQCNHNHLQSKQEIGLALIPALLVSAGGVLGSLLRFLLDLFFVENRPGIVTANILGSALAAHILVLMERRGITWARYFLLPGFCGGLTTFSGVTFEAMRYPHENAIFLAVNTLGSLTAIAFVLPLSRKWIKVKI